MNLKDNRTAYVFCFIITIMLFGMANILDQIFGNINSQNYPLFILLIWTLIVGTLGYLGWNIAFYINAVVLYATQIYVLFNLQENKSSIGTLPISKTFLLLILSIFLISVISQYFVTKIKNRTSHYEEEMLDD